MSITGEIVELAAVPLHPLATHLREKHIQMKGSEELANRRFPKYEWQRLSHVLGKLRPGQRCLEVGPGRCYLTTMMKRAGLYSSISAIDIVPRRSLPGSVDFRIMSVAEMDFETNAFDTVLCMEVLEHLQDDHFESALSELRRVCRGQLIVTLPYKEPIPLPAYHLQAFDEERIQRLFPQGRKSLLLKDPVTRVPWILVEEAHGEAAPRA